MTKPGEIGIINYLGIIFLAIFGFACLGEIVSIQCLLGMALIFAAALLLYFIKNSREIWLTKSQRLPPTEQLTN